MPLHLYNYPEIKQMTNAFPPWNLTSPRALPRNLLLPPGSASLPGQLCILALEPTVAPSFAPTFATRWSYACQLCIPTLEPTVAPSIALIVAPSFSPR